MNVLLIGAGAREHALAWKLARSPILQKLYIAPGNPGTAECGINVDIPVSNFPAIAQLVRKESIHLVVVGPEEPLANGIRDFFRDQDDLDWVGVIGPDRSGARLESSKDFAKQFMIRNGIPTAHHQTFTTANEHEAGAFIQSLTPPYVLKADGLAAGKGVLIVEDPDQALMEIHQMFNGKFGLAGSKVVVEEFLHGIELSVFILTDGESYLLLPEAKDYKRIGEGDTGSNTGGMGAVSPVPFADATFIEKVKQRIIEPTINGLKSEQIDYQGFIFFGLMNVNGDPYVIEYNVRMGDPESEVVIPRLETDLLDLFKAVKERRLKDKAVEISQEAAATIMLVSQGYPGTYEKGFPINGIGHIEDGLVFHAGTIRKDGQLMTNGGRVLALTAMDHSWTLALAKAYEMTRLVKFHGMYHRKDIGFDL